MNNLIEYIKKHKVSLIVAAVVWLLAEIFLVAPVAYSIGQSTVNGAFNLTLFVEQLFPNIAGMTSFIKVFAEGSMSAFGTGTLIMTIIIIVSWGIGLYKARSKSEFDKIEHGSSDWSQNGEQYRVLSKNKGLILAQKNYLPLDKLGNVNVLIVRRFWFW